MLPAEVCDEYLVSIYFYYNIKLGINKSKNRLGECYRPAFIDPITEDIYTFNDYSSKNERDALYQSAARVNAYLLEHKSIDEATKNKLDEIITKLYYKQICLS